MTWKSARPKIRDLDPSQIGEVEKLGYEWFEYKYDGHFAELGGDFTGWKLFSRTGKVKMIGEDGLPYKVHLIGEHIFGTQWACHENRKDLYDKVVIFGGFVPGTKDMVPFERVKEVVLHLQHNMGLPIRLIERFPISNARAAWFDNVIAGDWEGLVFKNSKGDIGRMKKRVTMDYVVMDVPESESGSYAGWGARALVGGLYVGGKLIEKVSISGLTDEQRLDFLDRRDELIGEVFEASGKTLFKSGALRHPSFERWRPDKHERDCVWAESE